MDGNRCDGKERMSVEDVSDIDTVAVFSSYGPSLDGRIKPDIVAPGDQASGRRMVGLRVLLCVFVGKSDNNGESSKL